MGCFVMQNASPRPVNPELRDMQPDANRGSWRHVMRIGATPTRRCAPTHRAPRAAAVRSKAAPGRRRALRAGCAPPWQLAGAHGSMTATPMAAGRLPPRPAAPPSLGGAPPWQLAGCCVRSDAAGCAVGRS